MCRVISLANSKGGTGKTTTCINLGIGLARHGYKVFLIDCDSQGSMTAGLGIQDRASLGVTVSTILWKLLEEKPLEEKEGILHHEEGVDFLPANSLLSDVETPLKDEFGGEWILKDYINGVKDEYDFILLDCQPSLNYITLNAFCSSDSLLIPMEAAYLSLMGLEQMLDQINKLRRRLNPNLRVEGILITQINERTSYAKEILAILNDAYGGFINIYSSRIPNSIRVAESSAEGVSIYKHDPQGKAALAYEALTEEVIG